MVARVLGFTILVGLIIGFVFFELGRTRTRTPFRLGFTSVLTVAGPLVASVGLIAYSGVARVSILVGGVCIYAVGLSIALWNGRR
jgi:hypothetical protein